MIRKANNLVRVAMGLLAIAAVIGCSESSAVSAKDIKNFKGSPPPADVWQKVGQAKEGFANHQADYGKIPGQDKPEIGTAVGPVGGNK